MEKTMGRLLRWKAGGAVLVWLMMMGVLLVIPGRADVGVRPLLPGGSSLQPDTETPVQMKAEKVVMTVRAATEADNAVIQLNPQAYGLQTQTAWFTAVADVLADFTMLNPIGEAVNMTAWFPLASALENVTWELNPDEIPPRIENFNVTVDGKPVAHTVSELPNPKGADRPPLPWASFPVTFPAGEETEIQVRYTVPLQPAVKGSELALYYIFQTGAGWAGPIGEAELVVNLPYPASDATLAVASHGSLSVPYGRPQTLPGLPAGTVLEGEQVRWTWQDFEPGPTDDFAAWLMDIGKWQDLQEAEAQVQADPANGQAWLKLAGVYRSLATVGFNSLSIFSESYLQPGIDAYHKAAELLPGHPAPHAGLALLSLAPFMQEKNAPPKVMQTVQDELSIARELEAKSPGLAEEAGVGSWVVEDILSMYAYNAATATADWSAFSTDWAKETEAANLTLTPPTEPATLTPTPSQTPEPTMMEEAEDTPAPSAAPVPAAQGGLSNTGIGILVVAVLVIAVVAYFVFKRK
jgi:hypothetical protein